MNLDLASDITFNLVLILFSRAAAECKPRLDFSWLSVNDSVSYDNKLRDTDKIQQPLRQLSVSRTQRSQYCVENMSSAIWLDESR